MTVVVLRLGNKGEDSEDNAIRLLSRLFSMNLSYEEKIDTLENVFKIGVSREMDEEVQSVCNLSTGVYHKGYDSGLSAGEMKKAQETAYELHDMEMPIDKIARAVKVDIDTLQEWLAKREALLVK